MKKLLLILFLAFACYAVDAQTVFYENFETPEGDDFGPGWVNIPTSGGENAWTRKTMNGLPAHDGRYARITYNISTPHDAWLITPGFTLTQGKTYTVSFWLFMPGSGGQHDKLEVKIGTSNTIAGMTELLFDSNNTDYAPWTLVSVNYTPTATSTYYMGWHAYSPPSVNVIVIDDITVEEQGEELQNDLQNTTKYP
jgi:hypothetical protein